MKFGTDSAILGAIATAKNPERILDIGTGTGVLALMLAQRYPTAKITGVELDEPSSKEAKINFDNSTWSGQFVLINNPIQNVSKGDFDLIISNPPFFANSCKNEDKDKARVRHTDELSLDDLLEGISRQLSNTGLAYIIYPSLITTALHQKLHRIDVYLVQEIEIYSSPLSIMPVRTIFAMSKTPSECKCSKFCIYDSQNTYSKEFTNLLKPYYLHL